MRAIHVQEEEEEEKGDRCPLFVVEVNVFGCSNNTLTGNVRINHLTDSYYYRE